MWGLNPARAYEERFAEFPRGRRHITRETTLFALMGGHQGSYVVPLCRPNCHTNTTSSGWARALIIWGNAGEVGLGRTGGGS
eukprot:953061-Prorocentrum_minimum.AAC.1